MSVIVFQYSETYLQRLAATLLGQAQNLLSSKGRSGAEGLTLALKLIEIQLQRAQELLSPKLKGALCLVHGVNIVL